MAWTRRVSPHTHQLREARAHVLEHLCQRLQHLLLEVFVRAGGDGLVESLNGHNYRRLGRSLRHLQQCAAELHGVCAAEKPRQSEGALARSTAAQAAGELSL